MRMTAVQILVLMIVNRPFSSFSFSCWNHWQLASRPTDVTLTRQRPAWRIRGRRRRRGPAAVKRIFSALCRIRGAPPGGVGGRRRWGKLLAAQH